MSSETAPTAPSRSLRVRPPTDLLLEREAEADSLTVGSWSLSLRGAEFDDVSYHGVLVARSIRLVVRDEDWGTLPMLLDSTEPSSGVVASGGLILRGRAGAAGNTCAWTLTLTIDDADLRVEARVEATSTFRRNRLGLIVLHPPALAGTPVTVEHPDGSRTSTVFPERISPHQPAANIRALSWRGSGDDGRAVDSVLRFSGDVFEMEDQRNWTDASFKTYSTPLAEPFPVELTAGTVVEQAVEVHSETAVARGSTTSDGRAATPNHARVTFEPADAARQLPVVTTSVSSGPVAGPPIAPAYGPLLTELDPGHATWRAILDRAGAEAGGRPLDLRLVVGRGDEVDPVLDHLLDAGIAVATIGVFDRRSHLSEPELLGDVQGRLDLRGIAATLLGGTRAHFTELNRNVDRLAGWRGPLAFSITPFMHDRGGYQLVESIAMQRLVVREALDIAHGRPLHIGPITLGARFNAVATSAPWVPQSDGIDEGFGAEMVTGATDPRQAAPSLGAWVLASVAALAVRGVASLSYFEASGDRGLVGSDGQPTAAAHVLEQIAELSGGATAPLSADHPAIVGLAVAGTDAAVDGQLVALVGNLGDARLTVEIDGVDGFELEPGSVSRVVVPAR